MVDQYLRLMGNKTILGSSEPRLESFYPPFVGGIDLPHQGDVVDSYYPNMDIHYSVMDIHKWIIYLKLNCSCPLIIMDIQD